LGAGTRGWGSGSGVTLWSPRQAFCQRFGMESHLASVHSEEELQAIAALLASSRSGEDSQEDGDEGVWIGLHRPLGVSAAPGQSPDPPGTPRTRSQQP